MLWRGVKIPKRENTFIGSRLAAAALILMIVKPEM
jgi:hypothetical protein